MKKETLPVCIQIHFAWISVQLPGQMELTFSSDLPARRQLRNPGYSEKGWLWCAFQEALERANVKLAHPFEVFTAIWEMLDIH